MVQTIVAEGGGIIVGEFGLEICFARFVGDGGFVDFDVGIAGVFVRKDVCEGGVGFIGDNLAWGDVEEGAYEHGGVDKSAGVRAAVDDCCALWHVIEEVGEVFFGLDIRIEKIVEHVFGHADSARVACCVAEVGDFVGDWVDVAGE